MLNYIGGRVDRMEIKASHLFDNMTDKDLILVAKSGQLKNLCDALSLDLHTKITDEAEC